MENTIEPQRSLFRPLAISLTATLGFSLLVGVLLLPDEIEEERRPYLVTLDEWVYGPRGELAWAIGRGEPQADSMPVRSQLYQVSNAVDLLQGDALPTMGSPTGMVAASGGPIVAFHDGQIRQYPSKERAVDIGQHSSGHILSLALARDEQRLMTWGRDACFWDLSTRQRVGSFPRTFTNAVLVSGADSFYCDRLDYIVERDGRTGKEIREVARSGRVFTMALAPDEQKLVVIGHDRSLQVIDLPTGKTLWHKSLLGRESITRMVIPFFSPIIALSPSGRTFAIVHEIERHDNWGVSVWKLDSGEEERAFATHQGRVVCARFARDDEIVTSGLDCRLVRWSLSESPPRAIEQWDTRDWSIPNE